MTIRTPTVALAVGSISWAESETVASRGGVESAGVVQADKGLALHETARLYALVNMAVADGLIAGWYWKRQHAFWRPITAIREASLDGNPGTVEDPVRQPHRPTPSHPDHPSTRGVTGGTASEVIRWVVGSDRHRFCMTTLTATPAGSVRCFERFSSAQAENINLRVYAGIHFRPAILAGDRLGRRIGRFAFEPRPSPAAVQGRSVDFAL